MPVGEYLEANGFFNMLFLTGLMGLMAVGAVTFVDPQLNGSDDDELDDATTSFGDSNVETPFMLAGFEISEDNFDPDYDPRGGDDAALLPPLDPSEEESVTLTEGSDVNDELEGSHGNDRIRGQDGADTLSGGAGDDELRGDVGDDSLAGDAGEDTLHGQDGDDIISGGDQDDVLFGHNDNDELFGDAGNDAMQGSAGNDALDGGAGDDTLQGGLDDDTLTGGTGADALFGGWGNDVLNGLMRNSTGGDDDAGDFLNGGGGDDSILVGNGDIVTAGDGADEIVLGDWLASGEAAQIMDYDPEDDSLVLIWDDSVANSTEPQITVTSDPDEDDQTLVWMGGTIVATVNGSDLAPSDIALIPLSTATQVGLAS